MKKLLTYMLSIICLLIGNIVLADANVTTFNVDELFFDVTSFSADDYSTIHFGTWDTWNSLGWAIFWWPKVDKEVTLKMNGQNIYCSKQLRGFYVNQVRWNVMWPLDSTTLWLFKWKLAGYQNLSLFGWFFTHCTWDLITNYNGIFGYVKHTTTDWLEYELRAGLDYKKDILWDNWWDSLWQEVDLDSRDFFIKWIIYDTYGGIGFINSTFNNPLILRNTTWDSMYINLKATPSTTSIWWNIEYTVDFGNNWDFYLDDVKVYLMIPDNIDANWYDIWDLTGNRLLLYNWDLYPFQSKHFTFEVKANKPGDMITTGVITAWLASRETSVQWFVANTKYIVEQETNKGDTIMIWDRVYFEVTLYNSGNSNDTGILLLDRLPKWFIYNDIWFEWYDDNTIILYSGELLPWQTFNTKIRWYFEKGWTFTNMVRLYGNSFETISNNIDIKINTHICGDWILEKDYEYCDDGSNNWKIWYCNNSCTKIVWAGVACKYTDANYLSNWPFIDTLTHWWYDYIEVMRTSCLHRWKWTFAWQWKYDPNEYVTKAEVLKTLVKIRWIAFDDFDIVNEDYTYDWVQVFADVPKNHRFSWYSFYAYDHGITDGLFTEKWNKKYLNPDWKITRNEIIKAIMQLYKEVIDDSDIDISGKSKLVDVVKWSSYYYQYVREAEELWIISWYDMPNGTKTWQWNNPLTRAEFAKMVSIPFSELLFERE